MMKTNLIAAALLIAAPAIAQTTAPVQPAPETHTKMPSAATAPTSVTDEASVRGSLTTSGYTDVQGLMRDADGSWKGTAMHGGQRVNVQIGADGQVMKTPM